jgi:hypothetical protein
VRSASLGPAEAAHYGEGFVDHTRARNQVNLEAALGDDRRLWGILTGFFFASAGPIPKTMEHSAAARNRRTQENALAIPGGT